MKLKNIAIFTITVFNLFKLTAVYSSGLNTGCLKSDSDSGIIIVIESVRNLIQCEIQKVEKKVIKEIPVWKVNAIIFTGGSISFEFSFDEIELIQINADEGPFDYDLQPLKESVSFSSARITAENQSGLKTLKWCFKKVKQNWEYNLWVFTKSGKPQIRINAITGELIKKKSNKNKLN